MKTTTIEMIGKKELERKLVRLISKNGGLITQTDTITDEDGEFYNLRFDIRARKFKKLMAKFMKLGDLRIC